MAIIRINELPSGSGDLSPDDLIVFMDDPSGSKITKKITVAELANTINSIADKSIFDIGTFYNETTTISIDYDINKTVQTITLIEGNYTFVLGSGWPIDKSVEILLEITVSDNVIINWDIVNEWYFDLNELTNPESGKYKLLLQKIGSNIGANYLGKKTNNFTYNLQNINSVHGDESQTWGSSIKNVATVGTNGGASYYGTYDQTGNVWEWTDEQGNNETRKVLRGGQTNASWKVDSSDRSPTLGGLSWSHIGRGDIGPGAAAFQRGFRIAARSDFVYDAPDSYLVRVLDRNNAADSNGRGRVAYAYKIGKYPITNCQYVEFLNSVAKGGENPVPPNVYLDIMSDDNEIWGGGINRETVFENESNMASFVYSVKENYGNKPVINISWFSAARYCNWLHNGKLSGNSAVGTTENGAYTLNNAGDVGDTPPSRQPLAKYWIPSADEWYKSAYYKGGGLNSGYWKYATQSNQLPTFVNLTNEGNGTLTGVSPVNFTNFQCDLPENLLFDTFRFLNDVDVVVPEPWKSRIIKACNRWNKFIKFNKDARIAFQNLYSGWNGISIEQVNIFSNPSSNTIASAGSSVARRFANRPHTFQTIKGILNINTFHNFTDSQWVTILTHEIGHILGILEITWINYITNNFLDGSVYINARNSYRQILNNNSLNLIALENSGGLGAANSHWEDSFRQPNFPGFVNEIMIGSFSPTIHNNIGYVISPLTIKALIDMGYEEQNPGDSEGFPMLTNQISIQNLDISDAVQLNCSCNHIT